jgi:hypothetical protein
LTAYNVYAGEATHGPRRFRPKGALKLHHEGAQRNPATRFGPGGYSARIFVGLNVGQRKAYSVGDVVKIVWATRKKQKRSGDASILAQKGIYEDRSGKRVVEPSVQIILIDLADTPEKEFTAEMIELAEVLCKRLKQETVILEIQKRGLVKSVYGVT